MPSNFINMLHVNKNFVQFPNLNIFFWITCSYNKIIEQLFVTQVRFSTGFQVEIQG